MNQLGDALKKALDEKKNDYSNFIWKGEKEKDGDKFVQSSVRMIDMTPEQLQKCYDQCNLMLYNTNVKNLGRYHVLDEVTEQIEKCNTELLLRYFENTHKRDELRNTITRFTLMVSLRQFMKNNSHVQNWTIVPITSITDNLPEEFHNISISEVLDGCTDNLG